MHRLGWPGRLAILGWAAFGFCPLIAGTAFSQEPNGMETKAGPAKGEPKVPGKEVAPAPPPTKVGVAPIATDKQIEQRLSRILEATNWFADPAVQVDEGVVFLSGKTSSDEQKKWAADLARSTEDVVAVVNRIEVLEPSLLDFSPALAGILDLWRGLVRGLPWILFSLFVIACSYAAARFTRSVLAAGLAHQFQNPLLRNVVAVTGALFVFLAGLYLILRVAGLTQLAFTVLGGTGLVGIILGIGFRDITENFLASILLSCQNPFRTGDLIEVVGVTGYVERMTIRSTMLMTLDGSHVQIPNATVYKNIIRNYTSNPNRREDFIIGIGYGVAIPFAQQTAIQVLNEHPAVLKDPEPWILVDSLGPSTVNLRVYFWLNGREHSWLKVRSSVIRLVKRSFQDHGIELPDESREVVFPGEIPVRITQSNGSPSAPPESAREPVANVPESESTATSAEGGLSSEAGNLKQQSRHSRAPEGENLLDSSGGKGS